MPSLRLASPHARGRRDIDDGATAPPSGVSWHTSVSPPSPCPSRPRVSRRSSNSPGSESRSHYQSDPAQGALPKPPAPVACPSVRLQGRAAPSRSPVCDRDAPLRIATACAHLLGTSPRAPASAGSTGSARDRGRHDPRAASSQGNVSHLGSIQTHITDKRIPNCLLGSLIRGLAVWSCVRHQGYAAFIPGTSSTAFGHTSCCWLGLEKTCADSKIRTALGLAARPSVARAAFSGPWSFAPLRALSEHQVPSPARPPVGRAGGQETKARTPERGRRRDERARRARRGARGAAELQQGRQQ